MFFIFLFIFQLSSSFSLPHRYNTTFCVCSDRKNIDCSKNCKNYRIIGYKSKDILGAIHNYKYQLVTFLVYGTTDSKKPKFDLNDFLNISLNIVSATKQKEYVQLNGIDKNHEYYNFDTEKFYQILHNEKNENLEISDELYSHFMNVNIYFQKGKYLFNHLILHESSFIPYSKTYDLSKKKIILQNFLTTDFSSYLSIPDQIRYISPTRRIQIACNESVNHVQFLDDYQIKLSIENESIDSVNSIIDLKNLKKNIRANIILKSRNLTLAFKEIPKNEDEIPKIDFNLKKSAKIFVDTEGKRFDDKLMKISNIRFIHGSSSIYFYSASNVSIPTFDEEGVGTVYKNDEVSLFFNNYCICEGKDCSVKCGSYSDHIIPYDITSLDKTVIGNPSKSLKYVVSNSHEDKGKHPVFDLEHFGDRTLTVIGTAKDEHIEFIGDGSDDVGSLSFTNLCFHGNRLLFPEVSLREIRISSNQRGGNESIILNSTLLKSDVSTLKNLLLANVSIVEPLNGYEIHTTNILNQVSLSIISPVLIQIDNCLNLPLLRSSTMKIFGVGYVNIYLTENQMCPSKVTSFPNLEIYLEGDKNVVTFPGEQWPNSLADLSSKLTLIHGENDVFVNGDTRYENNTTDPIYNTVPPIVNHEGTGALFFNGKLSNYADKYCICEPVDNNTDCEYLCQDYGPVTGFSAKEIEEKALGNPIRIIQYFLIRSTKDEHPIIDLQKFSEKSFSVVGIGQEKQFISLLGTYNPNFASSSVSHVFQNVDIKFENHGIYFFNNVEFTNCKFYTNVSVSDNEKYESNALHLNIIKIYHFGMTIDMSSFKSLYAISPHAIYPSKSYLRIEGGNELKSFSIENEMYILLNDKEESRLLVDVSMLYTPIQLTTTFGESYENPFVININEKKIKSVDSLPRVFVDVQGVPSSNSFVMFSGKKKWDGEFHDLTSKITVSYGQANIHIMTKLSNAEKETFSGLPPHVNLIGDGEYYINKVKQGSVYDPGDEPDSDDDQLSLSEQKWGIFWKIVMVIVMCVAVYFLGNFIYIKVKKRNQKRAFIDRWREERRRLSDSEISLNHFEIDLDDVSLSE